MTIDFPRTCYRFQLLWFLIVLFLSSRFAIVPELKCHLSQSKVKCHDGTLAVWLAVVLLASRIRWIYSKWPCRLNRKANCRYCNWLEKSFVSKECLHCTMAFQHLCCVSSPTQQRALASMKCSSRKWEVILDSWKRSCWLVSQALLEVGEYYRNTIELLYANQIILFH